MQGLFGIIIVAALAGIVGFLIYYFRDYIPIFQHGIKKTEVDAEIEGLLECQDNPLKQQKLSPYQ